MSDCRPAVRLTSPINEDDSRRPAPSVGGQAPLERPGDVAASYNEIPYPSFPFRKTHPDHLHALGRLFSLEPAEPARCRLLEIGCAGGGNLLPMADQLPEAQFVGVDYSEVQIRAAQEVIDQAQLLNVHVWAADIAAVDPASLGQFDYIVCHGVYSWVPPAVQQAILNVCHQCLAPSGIAYISFNTYPGWHFRGMIRDMMQFHVRQFQRPLVQIRQARALLKFLAENVDQNTAYGKLLNGELEALAGQSDSYLYHEHLEAHNQPVYFHHFAEEVRRCHLQYLGDAEIASMWLGNFPGSIAETIQRIAPDLMQQEQYMDFLRNRTFRQSLLCHTSVRPDRHLVPAKIADARWSGRLRLAVQGRDADLTPGVRERYVDPGSGAMLETSFAFVKGAIEQLRRVFPQSLSTSELWSRSQEMVGPALIHNPETESQYRTHLAEELLKLYVSGFVELKYTEDRFVTEVSERPRLSPLARVQARQGAQVATRRHEVATLEPLVRCYAELLDGTRTVAEVTDEIVRRVEAGELEIAARSSPEDLPPDQLRDAISASITETVRGLARAALLTA